MFEIDEFQSSFPHNDPLSEYWNAHNNIHFECDIASDKDVKHDQVEFAPDIHVSNNQQEVADSDSKSADTSNQGKNNDWNYDYDYELLFHLPEGIENKYFQGNPEIGTTANSSKATEDIEHAVLLLPKENFKEVNTKMETAEEEKLHKQEMLDVLKQIDLKNDISTSKTEEMSNNTINKNKEQGTMNKDPGTMNKDTSEPNLKLLSISNESNKKNNFLKTCGFCNKQFKQESRLVAHILWHTGDSSLNCNVCFKTYASVGSLTKHYKKSHNGEIMSEGEVCNTNVHTDDKQYLCHVCGKAFVRKLNLIKHEKLHTTTEQK